MTDLFSQYAQQLAPSGFEIGTATTPAYTAPAPRPGEVTKDFFHDPNYWRGGLEYLFDALMLPGSTMARGFGVLGALGRGDTREAWDLLKGEVSHIGSLIGAAPAPHEWRYTFEDVLVDNNVVHPDSRSGFWWGLGLDIVVDPINLLSFGGTSAVRAAAAKGTTLMRNLDEATFVARMAADRAANVMKNGHKIPGELGQTVIEKAQLESIKASQIQRGMEEALEAHRAGGGTFLAETIPERIRAGQSGLKMAWRRYGLAGDVMRETPQVFPELQATVAQWLGKPIQVIGDTRLGKAGVSIGDRVKGWFQPTDVDRMARMFQRMGDGFLNDMDKGAVAMDGMVADLAENLGLDKIKVQDDITRMTEDSVVADWMRGEGPPLVVEPEGFVAPTFTDVGPGQFPKPLAFDAFPEASARVLEHTTARDAAGNLEKMYHGTGVEHVEFSEFAFRESTANMPGIHFTDDVDLANSYAKGQLYPEEKIVRSFSSQKEAKAFMTELQRKVPLLEKPVLRDTGELGTYTRAQVSYKLPPVPEGRNVVEAYLDLRNPIDLDAGMTGESVQSFIDALPGTKKYPKYRAAVKKLQKQAATGGGYTRPQLQEMQEALTEMALKRDQLDAIRMTVPEGQWFGHELFDEWADITQHVDTLESKLKAAVGTQPVKFSHLIDTAREMGVPVFDIMGAAKRMGHDGATKLYDDIRRAEGIMPGHRVRIAFDPKQVYRATKKGAQVPEYERLAGQATDLRKAAAQVTQPGRIHAAREAMEAIEKSGRELDRWMLNEARTVDLVERAVKSGDVGKIANAEDLLRRTRQKIGELAEENQTLRQRLVTVMDHELRPKSAGGIGRLEYQAELMAKADQLDEVAQGLKGKTLLEADHRKIAQAWETVAATGERVTPRALREAAGMADTAANERLFREILSNWEAEGMIKSTGQTITETQPGFFSQIAKAAEPPPVLANPLQAEVIRPAVIEPVQMIVEAGRLTSPEVLLKEWGAGIPVEQLADPGVMEYYVAHVATPEFLNKLDELGLSAGDVAGRMRLSDEIRTFKAKHSHIKHRELRMSISEANDVLSKEYGVKQAFMTEPGAIRHIRTERATRVWTSAEMYIQGAKRFGKKGKASPAVKAEAEAAAKEAAKKAAGAKKTKPAQKRAAAMAYQEKLLQAGAPPGMEGHVNAALMADKVGLSVSEHVRNGLAEIWVEPKVAEQLAYHYQGLREGYKLGKIAELVQRFNAFWKGSILGPFIEFHARNFQYGAFLMGLHHHMGPTEVIGRMRQMSSYQWYALKSLYDQPGVTDLVKGSRNVLSRGRHWLEDLFASQAKNVAPDPIWSPLYNQWFTPDEILRKFDETGVTSPFVKQMELEEFERVARSRRYKNALSKDTGLNKGPWKRFREYYDSILGAENPIAELGMAVENNQRGALALKLLEDGKSWQDIVANVDATFIDYNLMTKAEREFLRPLIPFYMWTKNSIPILLKAFLENPGIITAAAKAQAALSPDDAGDRIRDMQAIPVWGPNEHGQMRYLHTLPTPTTELAERLALIRDPIKAFVDMDLATGLRPYLKMVTPPAQLVGEILTGRTAFFGTPIEQLRRAPRLGGLERLMPGYEEGKVDPGAPPPLGFGYEAGTANPYTLHFLSKLPTSRWMWHINGWMDNRRGTLQKVAGLLLAIEVSTVDERKERSKLARRIRQEMEDQGLAGTEAYNSIEQYVSPTGR